MIPEDKFGNPIDSRVFEHLNGNGRVLSRLGYVESKNKPNLCYKKIAEGRIYADMRGTEDVPIWVDTRQLFFWSFDEGVPKWKRRRIIKKELLRLAESACPSRLSFYAPHASAEFEDVSTSIEEEKNTYEWDDGYCRFCGKDFQDEGSFCSEECHKKYREALKTPCQVCSEKIEFFKEVRHPVSYFPEQVVFVHASCHNQIHKTDLYPQLKPSKEETDRFYAGK
ncbi:MAG: HNH endonuclease [Acidobacteria bacterium]|nr:HNH endonuclease [Acidobacteriota bacterium]